MQCPRCEASLVTFAFRGRQTAACDRCGYLGVSVDHHAEFVPVESWTDALRRFGEKN